MGTILAESTIYTCVGALSWFMLAVRTTGGCGQSLAARVIRDTADQLPG